MVGFGISIKGGGGGGGTPGITKVASEVARLALTPADGDFVVQLDDGTLWYYNGTGWELRSDTDPLLDVVSTDTITLTKVEAPPPYDDDTPDHLVTLQADVNLSAVGPDASNTEVDIIAEADGLRAQVPNSSIHALFSAVAPLVYDGLTGEYSMPAATNAADGYMPATLVQYLETVIQDLDYHINDTVGAHAATAISYSNATSGLTATDVQAAIDEVEGRVDSLEVDTHVAVTLAAVGATPNANGATLTGQQLNLEPASTSHPGVVTTSAQSFAGQKNFDSVRVGSTSTIDASLLLDVTSTTLAARPAPQMTEVQRDAIASPANGAVIYNTDDNLYQYFDGTVWKDIAAPYVHTLSNVNNGATINVAGHTHQ